MTRILTTVHLTDIQKEVLCKVQAAPNPQLAWEIIMNAAADIDSNFAAARDVLGNLGLLEVGDGVLETTDKGLEVMNNENLTDETGELTEEGQQLADIDRAELPEPKEPEEPMGGEELGGLEAMGDGGEMGEEIPMESFSLLRTINEAANKTK